MVARKVYRLLVSGTTHSYLVVGVYEENYCVKEKNIFVDNYKIAQRKRKNVMENIYANMSYLWRLNTETK